MQLLDELRVVCAQKQLYRVQSQEQALVGSTSPSVALLCCWRHAVKPEPGDLMYDNVECGEAHELHCRTS